MALVESLHQVQGEILLFHHEASVHADAVKVEPVKMVPSSYFAALSLLNRAVRLPNSMWLHARYGVGAIKLLAPSTEA